MRPIAEFIKTTLIGGLLIVLPVYIAVLLILKALQGLVAAVKPITAAIPGSVKFEEILAILILAAICFIAGLIVRTRAGLRAKNVIERRVLHKGSPATRCCGVSPDASWVRRTTRHSRPVSPRLRRHWFPHLLLRN